MIITACSPANYYKNNNNQQNVRKIKNAPADKVSFDGNNLTKAQRTELAAQLSEKMKNRPESVQKMYQCGIDFVNSKISNEAYLSTLYSLLNNTNNEEWKKLDEGEKWFVGNYGILFDISGSNFKGITDSEILKKLNLLLV